MGSIAATTKIRNIRENLSEPVGADDLTNADAGTQWTNTILLSHLNKGQKRCASIMREAREDAFQVAGTPIALVTTTKEYDLAARFKQLVGLRITTSGYEYIKFRKVGQNTAEFQERDALPTGNSGSLQEMIYDVIAQTKIKFADYPPAAMTLAYDYIEILADYTLAANSTSSIPDDESTEFEEAYATRLALSKTPDDKRIPFFDKEINRLETIVRNNAKNRQIRESEYVEPFYPC